MIRTRGIQAGLVAAALLLAACGDDDDSSGATTAASAATTTAGAATTAAGAVTTAGAATTSGGSPTSSGASTSSAATKTGTVPIGLLTPLSGRFGDYGAPFRDGAAYAVDEINKAGGFTVGDTKYTFDLKVVDDKSDQAASVQGATGLINDDDVVALFGPIGPLGPSVTQITTAEKILNFSSSSSVSAIAGAPANPLTFITNGSAPKRVQAAVDAIGEFVPGAKKVAILGPADETAAGITPLFEKSITDAGMTLNKYTYPTGTTDLSTVITRMVGDDPDVVILGWAQSDRVTQGPQLESGGLPKDVPVLLYADALSTCKTVFAGRQCINHPLAGADLTSADLDPQRQAFVDGFLKFTGAAKLPNQTAAIIWTYDFPGLLAQAMQKAGSVDDTEAIGKALHEVTRDGLIGKITFDEANKAIFGFDITNVAADGTTTTQNFA